MTTAWLTWLATIVLLGGGVGMGHSLLVATAAAVLVATLTALLRGYAPGIGRCRSLEHRALLRAGVFSGGIMLVGGQLTGSPLVNAAVVVATLLSVLTMQAGRAIVDRQEDRLRRRGLLVERILVVADNHSLHRVLDLIDDQPSSSWRIVACSGDCADEATSRQLWHAGDGESLAAQVERFDVSRIVVEAGALRDDDFLGELLAVGRTGVSIHVDAGLRGLDARHVRSTPFGRDTVLHLGQPRLLQGQRFLKRSFDILIAAATLLIASPLILLTAMVIKLEDGGPILFRQRRVGWKGSTFLMPKFRSMGVDAERQLHSLKTMNERDGVLFKMRNDPRVTRVGRVIRALSIDELPQLVSVIRGEMSLIGPRPALLDEVATFDDRLVQRHDVRPGVTGLWQVEARDNESFDAYRRLDLFYVENWSLLLDITILLQTVPAVVERGVKSLRRSQPAVLAPAIESTADLTGVVSDLMAS